MKNLPVGEILILEGVLTREKLEEALKWQKSNPGKRLGDTLIDLGYVSQNQFMKALERRLSIPFIELYSTKIEKNALALIPEHFARQNNIMPISKNNSGLKIATNDPLDFFVTEDIRLMTGLEVQTVIATKDDIKSAIDRFYSNEQSSIETNSEEESHNSINLDEEINNYANASSSLDSTNKIENAPVVKLVNTILIQAYRLGASDIHIEPTPSHTKVRLRVDGDLMEQLTISSGSHSALISRIKILGGMNIAEKRSAQDGRFDVLVEGSKIDVRVSCLPVVGGEKIVIRLLGMSAVKELDIQKVGLVGKNYEIFQKIIKNPYGLILITGPTGSGKTTTLYSALTNLIDPKINIITVEDPVEKYVDAINQVQVNVKSGLTFADGLRSILRQDPDVIMVGEMRDTETAEIAVRSSMTGHLVLSTIHTNDAASTITRLADLGIERFLIASSLVGIIAQRLVKVICEHCKKEYTSSKKEMSILGLSEPVRLYKGEGCGYCSYTGYRGRTPIFEIIPVTNDIKRLIIQNATEDDIRIAAQKSGTTFLRQNCIELVAKGTTTIDELTKTAYVMEL